MKVLFVCTGNICRSPTAEGVFRHLVEAAGLGGTIEADSCGLIDYHVGEAPDRRARRVARRRGVDLSGLRARKLERHDLEAFDLLLAMDDGHFETLSRLCPPANRDRVRLFLDFAPGLGRRSVPDPYYGDAGDHESVYQLIEAGAEALLAAIRRGRCGPD